MQLDRTEARARRLDGEDPLAPFREEFHVPSVYLCGNYDRFLDLHRFVQVLEEFL